jgi:hypothetical protein
MGPAHTLTLDASMRTSLKILIVGGRGRPSSAFPDGPDIQHFGSRRYAGSGDVARAVDCVRSGAVDVVIVLTNWLGHSEYRSLKARCKTAQVRLIHVSGGMTSAVEVVRGLVEVRHG